MTVIVFHNLAEMNILSATKTETDNLWPRTRHAVDHHYILAGMLTQTPVITDKMCQ